MIERQNNASKCQAKSTLMRQLMYEIPREKKIMFIALYSRLLVLTNIVN